MADPARPLPAYDEVVLPDVSNLVTEDDTPVDNFFQDKEAILLTDPLNASWPEGRPFVSAADVAIFPTVDEPIVPDMLLSLGVEFPESAHDKDRRCYYMWLFGKPPEVVIEIVSNKQGGEDGEKLERYARIKVPYYVIFDPKQLLSSRNLRVRQLSGASYVDKLDTWFPEVGLGLTLWQGTFDGMTANWLRWCDQNGVPLPTGAESAEQARALLQDERQRAESERQRAESERQRAESERQRAEAESGRRRALEQKLREMGVDPDSLPS